MDTLVSITIASGDGDTEVQEALDRALGWFRHVEQVCSRFDPRSEVFRLSAEPGRPVEVSRLLFEAVRFSLQIARLTGGAFDPTIGAALAQRGFDRNYLTEEHVPLPITAESVSYRDVILDERKQTIAARKPLLLDLGSVAKGLAIDLAAKELVHFPSFSIDAGGDISVKGRNERGEPWRIGIEHPRQEAQLIGTVQLTEGAVCTSGDYERRHHDKEGEHHLLDPRTQRSPREVVSCTAVSPSAMLADALSTAAFVLGPAAGLRLLQGQGVDGVLVTPDMTVHMTPGFRRLLA